MRPAQMDSEAKPTAPTWDDFAAFRGRRFLFAAGHFDFFSGAERQAVFFAAELVRRLDAHVSFIGWGGNGRFADEIRAVGARPITFPLNPGIPQWSDRLQLLKLAAFIRTQLRPEFLLPYVWMHCRVIGAIWRLTGAGFCWWNQRDEGRGIRRTWLERRLMRTLPAVVSNSWEGRDFLTKAFALPESRVRVVNNGVAIPAEGRDHRWRQKLGIAEDAFVVTMLANLTSFKDHLTLLKAFNASCQQCIDRNQQLVLAGSHEDTTDSIRALAVELGIADRVHLPGSVRDTEGLLRSTDLVVHSSVTEGCPNGVLEPMSLGLPVLGTNISGLRQALGQPRAVRCLSAPGDWADLGQRIAHRVLDARLRDDEGRQNRQRILEHFSIDMMARQSLDVIRTARGGLRSNQLRKSAEQTSGLRSE